MRDRTKRRQDGGKTADQRHLDRAEDRLDEIEQMLAERPDPTRPPLRRIHKLAFPVYNLGAWVWEVPVRNPTFRDLKAAAKHQDADATAVLIERLTPLKGDAIQQLSGLDVAELGDIIADFQERRPEPAPAEPS